MVNRDDIVATYERIEIADIDNPDVSVIAAYWESLRGQRFAPSWAEFDWDEIPARCIAKFTVVDVSVDPLDFVYRFWGTNLARGQKQEMTGHSVRDLRPPVEGVSIFNQFSEVCEARKPILFLSSVQGWMVAPLSGIAYRMPFSTDGEAVSHVVSYSDFQQAYSALQSASNDPYKLVE